MTAVVFGYGQPARAQRLARAGQTAGVGSAGLMTGERRLTVHEERGAGLPGTSCGAAAGARSLLVAWRS